MIFCGVFFLNLFLFLAHCIFIVFFFENYIHRQGKLHVFLFLKKFNLIRILHNVLCILFSFVQFVRFIFYFVFVIKKKTFNSYISGLPKEYLFLFIFVSRVCFRVCSLLLWYFNFVLKKYKKKYYSFFMHKKKRNYSVTRTLYICIQNNILLFFSI